MNNRIPRRRFLSATAVAASAVGLGVHAKAAVADDTKAERFQYNVERFRQVDPDLIHYKPVARFTVPKPESRRLAIGSDQRLYVAAGTSLLVLNEQGGILREIPIGGPVRSIALASDSTLHAGVKDHVELFDPRGKRIATWETPKGRPLLTGISVTKNDAFVADAGNRIVWRYDRSGKLLRRIGDKNSARNIPGFVIPSPFFDLEACADGLLRVANPGRRRIETYTFDGDLELAWGKAGAAIDAFCGCCNPCNITVQPDGRVVTCEKGLPRVKMFSATGEFRGVVAGPVSFADPAKAAPRESNYGGLDSAIDARGRVFVLDLIAGDVQVFVPKEGKSAEPAAA